MSADPSPDPDVATRPPDVGTGEEDDRVMVDDDAPVTIERTLDDEDQRAG